MQRSTHTQLTCEDTCELLVHNENVTAKLNQRRKALVNKMMMNSNLARRIKGGTEDTGFLMRAHKKQVDC